MERLDLVIVGMGSAGMTAADFAATLGLRVAAVERGRVGGDCLWTGCVPSKALLAAAKAAHAMRTADRWGLTPVDPVVDAARVWERVRAVQEAIATSDDDPERYRARGVEVVHGTARLAGPHEVAVDLDGGGRRTLVTDFVLLCPGSRPRVPDLPGLEAAGYLTNESVFELRDVPASFTILGGGPIGVELAQALARLGRRVVLLQRGPMLLPREEPDLVARLTAALVEEGVDVRTGVEARSVRVDPGTGEKVLRVRTDGGAEEEVRTSELLVATGREPSIGGLDLEAVGIATGPQGIEVDDRLRTSVPSIYACGDAIGGTLFTHSAGHGAVRAVRDMFFPGSAKVPDLIPWCTFTDPELAHAGLTVAEAEARHGADGIEVHRIDLARSDRARADGAEGAFVVVTAGGTIVGASILAPAAGELIHELALAITSELGLDDVSRLVHVYPTYATSVGQLAAEAVYERARQLRWLLPVERQLASARSTLRRLAGRGR